MNFFLIILTANLVLGDEWTYDDAENWANDYPICGGKIQTPINIESGNAICDVSTINIAYLNDPIKAVTVNLKIYISLNYIIIIYGYFSLNS